LRKSSLILFLAIALSLLVAAPVLAAAPSNDTYSGRTEVSLGFSETLDTTEATTDADDAEANAECGAPATDASVWYELTSAEEVAVLVDVSESDYSAGVIVVTGSPGSFAIVDCGPGAVAFLAEAGTAYAILAFDDQLDEGGNGGTLVISISEPPPPPDVTLTVDGTGTFDPITGAATITGTITCTDGADAFIDVSASQRVGRFTIRGFGFTEVACDGSEQAWSVEVRGESGQFKGGNVNVEAFAFACNEFDCSEDSV
jgi:hypothetical protein